jgi:signal transduction histidine kinase
MPASPALSTASLSPVTDIRSHQISLHRRLLILALGALLILVGWASFERFSARGEYGRLAVLGVLLALYTVHTTGILERWYKTRGYRGYFLSLFVITGAAIYAGVGSGAVHLLTLPAMSQAILFLPHPRSFLVAAAFFLIGLYPPWSSIGYQLLNHGSFASFVVAFSWMMRRENENRIRLEHAHEQLKAYAAQAESAAIAEERARFSREIHDGVAHHLTAANVLVEAGLALLPPGTPPTAIDSLKKGCGQIRTALTELRESIQARAGLISQEPLIQRIEELITRGGFPATLTRTGPERRLTAEAEQALFRVAQETLTNARKHAPGAAIRLVLDFQDAARTRFSAENAEPAESASGDGAFGLLSLRERVERLGGVFSAGPDGRGAFIVRVEVPA